MVDLGGKDEFVELHDALADFLSSFVVNSQIFYQILYKIKQPVNVGKIIGMQASEKADAISTELSMRLRKRISS